MEMQTEPDGAGANKAVTSCSEEGSAPGLLYRRTDGSTFPIGDGEQWLVTLRDGGGVQLRRYIDGKIDEGYRQMDDAEGAVAILGAILGFAPPRIPIRRDRRVR